MRKRDFPVDDVRRFLEPGPIVLVSSALLFMIAGPTVKRYRKGFKTQMLRA